MNIENPHTHIPQVGAFIKSNWVWLMAAASGLYYSSKFTVKLWLRNIKLNSHPTRAELEECKATLYGQLSGAIKEHEVLEFGRFDKHQKRTTEQMAEHRREVMEALADQNQRITHVYDKVDEVKTIIIKHLDK